jgi:hypothetical protein
MNKMSINLLHQGFYENSDTPEFGNRDTGIITVYTMG